MNHVAKPAKMLICFIGRHRGEQLVQVTKAAGARGGTIALGQSLGNNKLLAALSLGDVQQDVMFTVLGDECDAVVKAIKEAAEKDPKKLGGTAVLLDVPEFFMRKNPPNRPSLRRKANTTEDKKMESGYKLITVIVNSGYGDDMMAAARNAGATGGTILSARGTGTEEDVKFFGITLVPEKEMLLIVAAESCVRPIVEALSAVSILNEPGGGVLFNMNVEEFVLLGKQKPWSGCEVS